MLSPVVNGSIRVALAAVIWGAAYPLTKLVLVDAPPITLGFLRFFIAALIFVAFTRQLPLASIPKTERRVFFKLAFWGVFLLILGMNFGLIWAPGMAASVLSGTPPLFTVILAAIFLGEHMQTRHFISIILALAGLALLSKDFSLQNDQLENWKIWAGCLLTLVPQFSWAMYGISGKKLSQNYHWSVICRETFALGSLMLLPFAAIEAYLSPPIEFSGQTLAILAYLAVLNSVVTYSLWNSALKIIPVSTASFLIYLQPVSGSILSYFLFDEKPGMRGATGIALIFLALTIVLWRRKNRNEILHK
jgi:drug/metabolite transporter (DMT)-like permease